MKTLTMDQQQRQNTSLLNTRLSDMMTREEVLTFCKRARIDVCCECVDNDVQDAFLAYYSVLPIWNGNYKMFNMVRL